MIVARRRSVPSKRTISAKLQMVQIGVHPVDSEYCSVNKLHCLDRLSPSYFARGPLALATRQGGDHFDGPGGRAFTLSPATRKNSTGLTIRGIKARTCVGCLGNDEKIEQNSQSGTTKRRAASPTAA